MRYFVMESINNEMPRQSQGGKPEVRQVPDLSDFYGIDYVARDGLISDRLKLLIELYMPGYDFKPVAFLDMNKPEQIIFWEFNPTLYNDCQADYRNNGLLSHISLNSDNAPPVFSMRSPKGLYSIIVHISVAESILRRNILGLKLTRLLECRKN